MYIKYDKNEVRTFMYLKKIEHPDWLKKFYHKLFRKIILKKIIYLIQ